MTYPVKSGHTNSGRISDENPKVISYVTFESNNCGSAVARTSVNFPGADYFSALKVCAAMHQAAVETVFLDLRKASENIENTAKYITQECLAMIDGLNVVQGSVGKLDSEYISYISEICSIDNINKLYVLADNTEINCWAIAETKDVLESDIFALLSIKYEDNSEKNLGFRCVAFEDWQIDVKSLPEKVIVLEKR